MIFETIQVDAHAKLNLALHVTSRTNDGYHQLRMLNVAIGLHDTIIVKDATENSIAVECSPFVASRLTESELAAIKNQSTNSASRAAALFHTEFNTGRKTAISLGKRIPSEAGLGGGSSDAAAVLNALAQQLLPTNPENLSARLLKIANTVGADVPYFLFGGCAQVSGRGEIVAPIRPNPFLGLPLILIVPPFGCSTAAVYSEYRTMNPKIAPKAAPDFVTMFSAKKLDGEKIFRPFHNDLEAAAIALRPELGVILKAARSIAGISVGMTGSGSVLFACPGEGTATADVAALEVSLAGHNCSYIETRVL